MVFISHDHRCPWPSKARPRGQQTWNLGPNIFRRINTWPMKFSREVSSRQKMISYRRTLSNCCKCIQNEHVVVLFATKSDKTNIKHKKSFLPQASPLHKHISKNSNAKKPAAKQHQNRSCNFFWKHFSTMSVAALHGSLSAWLMIKKAKNTDILGEKHDEQWLLKMCCLVRFYRKCLACLFSCNICHACLR